MSVHAGASVRARLHHIHRMALQLNTRNHIIDRRAVRLMWIRRYIRRAVIDLCQKVPEFTNVTGIDSGLEIHHIPLNHRHSIGIRILRNREGCKWPGFPLIPPLNIHVIGITQKDSRDYRRLSTGRPVRSRLPRTDSLYRDGVGYHLSDHCWIKAFEVVRVGIQGVRPLRRTASAHYHGEGEQPQERSHHTLHIVTLVPPTRVSQSLALWPTSTPKPPPNSTSISPSPYATLRTSRWRTSPTHKIPPTDRHAARVH